MYIIFDCLHDYLDALTAINKACGLPNNFGTETYFTREPKLTLNGKYAMPFHQIFSQFVAEYEIVENIEYPEATNE